MEERKYRTRGKILPRRGALIAGIVLTFSIGYAHVESVNAQPMQFRGCTDADGLYSNTVSTLYQDEQGFVWVDTEKSLQRYDGNSFKLYGQDRFNRSRMGDVRAIMEDREGRLWVAAGGRLYAYEPYRDAFSSFSPAITDINREDLRAVGSNDVYTAAQYGEHQLIVGTTRGVLMLHIEEGTWSYPPGILRRLEERTIEQITFDHEGRLWLMSRHQGVARFDPRSNELLDLRTTRQMPPRSHRRRTA